MVFSMSSPTLVSIQGDKVIVSMPQLLQLVPSTCLHPCTSKLSHSIQFRGCGVYLHFRCDQGHTYSWSSSDEHLDKRGYSVHSNDLLLAGACLLSGNCFSKVSQMLEFMGIKTFSENLYYRWMIIWCIMYTYVHIVTNSHKCRYQRAYFFQPIESYWKYRQAEILNSLQGIALVSGDGRCDFPGFSAMNCTYSLMDTETKLIVHSETLKRFELRRNVYAIL